MNRNPKYAHRTVKPENMILNTNYAFSLNPQQQPEIVNFYKVKLNTYKDWSNQIYDKFRTMRYCKISTYLEISKLGRFHFHGTIKIHDKIKFVLYDLKRLMDIGTLEIDTIEDEMKWHLYCTKLKYEMEQFCCENDMDYRFQ